MASRDAGILPLRHHSGYLSFLPFPHIHCPCGSQCMPAEGAGEQGWAYISDVLTDRAFPIFPFLLYPWALPCVKTVLPGVDTDHGSKGAGEATGVILGSLTRSKEAVGRAEAGQLLGSTAGVHAAGLWCCPQPNPELWSLNPLPLGPTVLSPRRTGCSPVQLRVLDQPHGDVCGILDTWSRSFFFFFFLLIN